MTQASSARSPRPTGRPPVVEGGQDARLTIRLSSQQAKRIRDIHAQTFPTHRMSLNRWMAATLLAAKT